MSLEERLYVPGGAGQASDIQEQKGECVLGGWLCPGGSGVCVELPVGVGMWRFRSGAGYAAAVAGWWSISGWGRAAEASGRYTLRKAVMAVCLFLSEGFSFL